MRLIAKVGIIIGIIIAVIVVAGAALFYTTISMIEEQMGIVLPDYFEQMVLDVDHADLVRNNSEYVGEVIKGTGQIINIEERSSEGQAYLIDAGDG